MHADTVVALIAALLATIVAVVVPWVTFHLALRQDHVRWVRDQRSQLYVDLITEAHAQQEWLQFASQDKKVQDVFQEAGMIVDMRLPPVERARLGARGTIFGSQEWPQVREPGLTVPGLQAGSLLQHGPDVRFHVQRA